MADARKASKRQPGFPGESRPQPRISRHGINILRRVHAQTRSYSFAINIGYLDSC